MAEKYILRVTAGSNYDIDSHRVVPVNSHEPLKVSNDLMDIELNVRVQNYKGLPRNSPKTSPYFSQAPHNWNKDQYSICFRFTPKKPASDSKGSSVAQSGSSTPSSKAEDGSVASQSGSVSGSESKTARPARGISAHDLQFGNDFDHPIRDRLPPGFNTAMGILKWWIDPGLEGDAYADQPYLYGPALSSFNVLRVGQGEHDPEKGGLWFEEGGDGAGLATRRALGAPDTSKERMKWALRKNSKENFVFEYGQTYGVDFFNPYIDFGDFSIKLPGFSVSVLKYWDGKEGVRYVLRNRSTSETYLVVLFTLYLKEDINEDGSLKPAALASHLPETEDNGDVKARETAREPVDQVALEEARKKLEGLDVKKTAGKDEDVD